MTVIYVFINTMALFQIKTVQFTAPKDVVFEKSTFKCAILCKIHAFSTRQMCSFCQFCHFKTFVKLKLCHKWA